MRFAQLNEHDVETEKKLTALRNEMVEKQRTADMQHQQQLAELQTEKNRMSQEVNLLKLAHAQEVKRASPTLLCFFFLLANRSHPYCCRFARLV